MNRTDVIFERRSIRSYTGERVSDGDMKTILMAGMAAPSAMNSQPWEFLVVRDRDMLGRLSKVQPYWTMLDKADAAVIVLGNIRAYKSKTKDFFIQDCSAATENMLLAATALGLGAVWLGLYPKAEPQAALRQLLQIPEDIVPFSVIALGHPKEQKARHEIYDESRVHLEQY